MILLLMWYTPQLIAFIISPIVLLFLCLRSLVRHLGGQALFNDKDSDIYYSEDDEQNSEHNYSNYEEERKEADYPSNLRNQSANPR